MKRREFLSGVTVAGAGVGVLWASACGDDDGGGGADDAAVSCTTGATVEMADGHAHSLTVPLADVNSGMGARYMTTGGTHVHNVTMTPTNFRTLRSTGSVMVGTDGIGTHEHAVLITCA